ncbi:MAG: Crp/Fnr family transcriptional regulator [Thermoanaerobaculia bacterium]|nr:Crp/Fnr family transcriptional regulator [Thermoanaerobaculia bacterium]
MRTPYNLSASHDCTICPERENRRFCDMPKDTVTRMNEITFTSFYPKGSLLFVEGEKARGVFILCSGRVKLTTSSAEGRTLILRNAQAGELLGSSAVISGKPYETSIETVEPCQVNFIRADHFMTLIENDRVAMLAVARQLSEDYHAAQREVRTFGLAQTTGEKLARLVLDWCTTGEKTDQGVRLKVLMTHEEIAQMIGTTRETVTRLLSQLRRKKILEIKGSTFLVPHVEMLESMVSV